MRLCHPLKILELKKVSEKEKNNGEVTVTQKRILKVHLFPWTLTRKKLERSVTSAKKSNASNAPV